MLLYFIISLPFLFFIGILYNSLKEQKRFERTSYKEFLEKRKEEQKKIANLSKSQIINKK